ncbi:MAG TPA: TasA family protein [Patescibacteria group bacterium]|nr:TasA family protein [Patescibacteria group bacterium]
MKNIAKSLVIIVAVAAVASFATYAYFSSQASVVNNTFSTGTLEVRANGQTQLQGMTFNDMAPGTCKNGTFDVQNYGNPYFPTGSSTLDIKELAINVTNVGGDYNLRTALTLSLYANAGWSGCSNSGVSFVAGKGCQIYAGQLLTAAPERDVLEYTQWGSQATLAPGHSVTINYEVCLPNTSSAQNYLQGKTADFDFGITAFNPHR